MEARLNSVDLLRGIAIMLMIQMHVYIYWMNISYNLFGRIIITSGQCAAPFFLIVSGISYFLYMNKKISKDNSKKEIIFDVLKRAGFIFAVSTLLSFLFGFLLGLERKSLIYWSIFQVIAFAMLLFVFIPFLKRQIRVLNYFSLIGIIFFLNIIIIYYNLELLYVFVKVGDFPFFSFSSLFLFGMFLGDLIIYSFPKQFRYWFIISIPIGIISILIFVLWENMLTLYIMSFGIFINTFSIIYFYTDLKKKDNNLNKLIKNWGKFSFSIYYIQFGIIIIGLYLFPIVLGDYFGEGFIYYYFIIIMLLLYLGLEIMFRIWEKYNYFFSLEWFLSKITKKSFFI